MTTDLDELERLYAEWHPKPQLQYLRDVENYHRERLYGVALQFHDQSRRSVSAASKALAAFHNAMPALIAELRALRAESAMREEAPKPFSFEPAWRRAVARDAEHDSLLREALEVGRSTVAKRDAEIVALRAENARLHKIFDDAGHGEHNVLALIDHYQEEAESEYAERMRIALSADQRIEEAIKTSIEHLEARMRAEAERDALREVAEVADDFVPKCEETTYDEEAK